MRVWLQTRRTFVQVLGSSVVGLAGCGNTTEFEPGSARLSSRPGTPTTQATPGIQPLGLGSASRDGFLLVPASYDPDVPTPLVLSLHGAGGNAEQSVDGFGPYAEDQGFVLLAPDSRGNSWDAIRGTYGPDVGFVDNALALAFTLCNIDPALIVVEGFSDGASYALGLGLANGDLFGHIMAFSPGGIPIFEGDAVGDPRVFVSHGTNDQVLPIDPTSRSIVAQLEAEAYDVTFVEHTGGHTLPVAVADQAMVWAFG
jgi:predicted esterase